MATTSTVFIIYNTAGVPIAAIQPETLNGPSTGAVQQSSDLDLFGLGYPAWGAFSDQNDYRLLQNFACPQSVTNPSPVQPMGSAELGAGNGINAPIVGQLWYNTTNNSLYVYTAANQFEPTAGTAVYTGSQPTNPMLGNLWYNAAIPQLEVYNGTAFVSVAALYLPLAGGTLTGALSMSNNQIHNVQNPTAASDAATKQYVDTVASGSGAGVFVPIAGNAAQPMTGTLYLDAGLILNAAGITCNTNIVINAGALTINSPPSGIAINANGRITNITTSTTSDAVNATYGDTRWLNKLAGGTVAGVTTFTSPVTIPLTPTASTQAASKGYVDSAIATVTAEIPTTIVKGGNTGTLTGNATHTITFPTPFPHACLSVVLQPVSGEATYAIISQSASGFEMNIGATETYNWIAVGN